MSIDSVADDEILYRRIPPHMGLYVVQADGAVKFSSQAFNDRSFRPSVDRAKLRQNDPKQTQREVSDGVTSVLTHDVRAINNMVQNDEKGKTIQSFTVDVEPVPIFDDSTLPDNPAHAEIHTIPQCPNKAVFRRLCERLAQLATARGWEIEPSEEAHKSDKQ